MIIVLSFRQVGGLTSRWAGTGFWALTSVVGNEGEEGLRSEMGLPERDLGLGRGFRDLGSGRR